MEVDRVLPKHDTGKTQDGRATDKHVNTEKKYQGCLETECQIHLKLCISTTGMDE